MAMTVFARSLYMTKRKGKRPGKRVVYSPYRRCPKTGRLIWAKWYGYKAWRFEVDDDE